VHAANAANLPSMRKKAHRPGLIPERGAALGLAFSLLVAGLVLVPISPASAGAAPSLGALGASQGGTTYASTKNALIVADTPSLQVAPPVGVQSLAPKVLLLSTGVGINVLPAQIAAKVSSVVGSNDLTDGIGFGTMSASAIFQVLKGAQISTALA